MGGKRISGGREKNHRREGDGSTAGGRRISGGGTDRWRREGDGSAAAEWGERRESDSPMDRVVNWWRDKEAKTDGRCKDAT